jgi:hypothetical protein
VLPLTIGGLTYALGRESSLKLFHWLDEVTPSLALTLGRLRVLTVPAFRTLPAWVRFSAADALWVYSLTFYFAYVWRSARRGRLAGSLVGPFIGIGSELGQAARLVPGTFDTTDLAFTVSASALALFAVHRGEFH